MLLHLLARPVSFLTSLTSKNEMAVLCQERDSSDNVACYGYLGIHPGAAIQWPFR